MKFNDVTQSIRMLKGTEHAATPDTQWLSSNRSRLLTHIDRTTEEMPTRVFTLVHLWSALSLIMPQRTVYAVVRPAFIFVLCFGLGTAGWITTVSASLESLPGDALYGVKLATEHTQVAVVEAVQGKRASTELRLTFVSRRVDEVGKLVAAGTADNSAKQERVNQAVENLKSEVRGVSDNLNEVKASNPMDAVHVAQAIDRKVDVIQLSLISTNATTSSTEASAVIAQLKQESGAAATSTSSMNGGAPSSTPAAASSPNSTATSTTAATTSSTKIIAPLTRGVLETPLEQPIVPKKELIPERPTELGPDVVDVSAPISIQMRD